ncbi:MAG: aldehyde dehydrogenase family protein, partial [Bdellovibrionales bacterium]|nr:aldehyde dehydrogenase family protein [Bdellovibrionales bacterium]
ADEAARLFQPRPLGTFPGEHNIYTYEPRGVAVVISPWNFPLAIPCGMFAAALVTGNTVVLKPAEQTSFIAKLLFEAFLDAGMPSQVAAFLPGIGEEVGPVLTRHRLVQTLVFTGSRAVGLQLVQEGATHHGEHVKRVIAEMGGKNAVLIDDDAELDEAVRGSVISAFGFQGQKCSACSRLIVVGSTYDRVVERLGQAVESLIIGPASRPETFVGAVIDEDAQQRILGVIEDAKRSCRLIAQGAVPAACRDRGFFVPPSVFGEVPQGHALVTQEIFGPVLAVERAATFEEALSMALDSEYGLTGGVFSRSPEHIQLAVREFRVGNLYINRPCTGALVGRQPFGGAKMSGVGSKAGGPDYLLQFVVPRTVTENTMRRGFAPDL